MGVGTDPRVDAYIDALPAWQADLCRELRAVVHRADDDVVETIKRTDRPYFTLQGNICALLAAKDHVNLFLYDGAIVPDPAGIITGGHDNIVGADHRVPAGRRRRHRGAAGDAAPDHREQPRRWLARDQEGRRRSWSGVASRAGTFIGR